MNNEGLAAARRYAGWHLGDREWADLIITAYNNPAETNENLDREMES